MPLETRAFLGTFRRRLFQEANKNLGSVFSIEENHISRKSKIFYFETNCKLCMIILLLFHYLNILYSIDYRYFYEDDGDFKKCATGVL